ncbi:hypothetical protein ACX9MO_01110 [Pseudooceanicola sp. 502str34]|uniref:hypothetical protein n=1 Tax=Maritimibacter alkaliphilus TaxID=404236 RepID=UPI001C94F566|nr:hypothetical protein [Maritimibacter alkaliphilus]MBY6090291.1 hypothetical protein [Maritimibacter alkaliphilus]
MAYMPRDRHEDLPVPGFLVRCISFLFGGAMIVAGFGLAIACLAGAAPGGSLLLGGLLIGLFLLGGVTLIEWGAPRD